MTPTWLLQRGWDVVSRKVAHLFRLGPSYDAPTTVTHHEDLDAVGEMIRAQAIQPLVDKVFTLDNVVDAFEYLQAGHATGKVVVSVAAER
jgi:NADPH:quinone reductase-like Zn-dependent oxidoreductase